MKRIVSNERGQTSVEYILLVAAMSAVIFSILSTLNERLLPATNPCPETDTSIGCQLTRIVDSMGSSDPAFRYFRIRK